MRRWLGTVTVLAVVAAAATATVLLTRASGSPAGPAAATTHTGTAHVVRTTLRTTKQYYGTLGYGTPVAVTGATAGQAYTWLPRPGAVIRQGETLCEVDGRSVPLLAGARPAWRRLAVGVPDGPDVGQLNTDLVALGYASGIAGNTTYDWRTRAAVEDWQTARGVPATGAIELGEVVFASAPLRVAGVTATVGGPAQPGQPLLSATGPAQLVDLPVPVDQAYLVHRGDPVTVTMPDAVTQVSGTVVDVSAAASQASTEASGAPQPNGPPAAATVDATIRLRNSGVAARFTSAPVSVAITVQQARNVLAVPVSALLARPGGGYAVTVVDELGSHDVPVTPGLYSDALVQISGPGIRVGTTVAVPS